MLATAIASMFGICGPIDRNPEFMAEYQTNLHLQLEYLKAHEELVKYADHWVKCRLVTVQKQKELVNAELAEIKAMELFDRKAQEQRE